MKLFWCTAYLTIDDKIQASILPSVAVPLQVTIGDKISTSLVECEHVKAKIGKALRADGSPRMWKKLPPARGQKGFLS